MLGASVAVSWFYRRGSHENLEPEKEQYLMEIVILFVLLGIVIWFIADHNVR
jgi:hypothetical protein